MAADGSELRRLETFQSFRVGCIEVDGARLRIVGRDAISTLEPKVMALLLLLAQSPGTVWHRGDLIDSIWGPGEGGDESLTRVVYLLRKAIDEHDDCRVAIRTISKTGYCLEADAGCGPAPDGAMTGKSDPEEVESLSIAVLPVEDLSQDRSNACLVDGMTRDLTALLSRTPRFVVTPYSTAARFGAAGGAAPDSGETILARFVVSGTMVRSGDSIRLRMELVDTVTDKLVWSHRYDAHLDQFFEVQHDVILSISTAVSTMMKILLPQTRRSSRAFNLSAYEQVQAAEAMRLRYGRQAADDIVRHLEAALEIEPDNPVARAALGVQLSQNVVSQWAEDPEATVRLADAHIRRALEEAPGDPDVVSSAGVVAAMFHRPDQAIKLLERATRDNPNDPHGLAVLGWQKCLRHDDPDGVRLIKAAEERAPHHPRHGLWATYRATAWLFMLRYDEAEPACREAIARTPNYYQPHMSHAWALTGLGDVSRANRAIARAQGFGDSDIAARFVAEMKKWSSNSPNRASCWAVLDRLAATALTG